MPRKILLAVVAPALVVAVGVTGALLATAPAGAGKKCRELFDA